jgi:putative transposase
VAEGDQFAGAVTRICSFAEKFWGRHLWARGYLAVSSGTITDEMIREYIDEQEGEQIADDSRFPIDNS